MIIVAYSGSRFANWRIAEKGRVITGFKTSGINPFQNDERSILQLLHSNSYFINYAERIKRIYFFGAGVTTKAKAAKISNSFSLFFKNAKVYAYLDMQAAAIATCNDHEGIVGIIGSGSNAAYYNGKKLEKNNFGLGYILADEGSTTWLGKQLVTAFIIETMPKELSKKFYSKYSLDKKQIMERVYRQANPTLFLSSFADFVLENREHVFISNLIEEGFSKFFEKYLVPLKKKHPNALINFSGSIAADYEELLRKSANKYKMEIGIIIREPIHNLVNYYINKNK
jgi:N-acetylglucosamine kinase-like BadF-type ATPase